MTEKKNRKPKDFESALEKLEDITNQLESGDVKLEEAIKLYTNGVEYVDWCNSKLAEIEKKILVLKEKNGKVLEEDFNSEE